jgi:UDP:flavonoid glycosyltransferase YjiC (YdhE family)
MGHLLPHRELLANLLQRGHIVHVASRDVSRAGAAFAGLSVHFWPVPLSLDLPQKVYQPTISFPQILHNVGFANAADVIVRISAWCNLYDAIRSEVLLADYSPTAILAARGRRINVIPIGLGFCLPPNRIPVPAFATLAHLATTEQLMDSESLVTATINAALEKHGLPKVNCLADVFHQTHAQLITTLPELDHYSDRGPAEYCGIPAERAGKHLLLPPGIGRRIFAYLKPFPAIEALFSLLNQMSLPSIVACDGLSEGLRQKHASATLTFVDADVDLARLAPDCYLAITNANPTTSARFLLAGKPVLMIPRQLEQELFAHTVTRQGLGLTVSPNEPQDLFPKLAELLNSDKYHKCAADLASKYATNAPNYLERVIEVIERR